MSLRCTASIGYEVTMMLLDRLTTRALSLLGLHFDFSNALQAEPFHRITPTLVLGARPRVEQLADLQALGITHVVSCLAQDEQPSVAFLNDSFETLFLPLRDGAREEIAAHFPPFFEFIDEAGPTGQVFVHCQVGVSRSATLVTAHLMKAERLRFFDAYQQVRARRAQVLPNVGFASQLQQLERTLLPDAPPGEHSSLARYLHEVCNAPVELEVLASMLERHDQHALPALRAIFGDEIPRVVQGVRF